MFPAAKLPSIHYKDPWAEALQDRVCALMRRGVQRRVAYLYPRPDSSTFRYRVFNTVHVLQQSRDTAAAWFAEHEADRLLGLLEACDVLVVCRAHYSKQVARLLTRAEQLGIDTIFDVDDFVFDTDYVHLLIDTLDETMSSEILDYWFATVGRIGATMRRCRRVTVTNDYLAGRAAQFAPGKDIRIVPNFLNPEQLELSDRIVDRKRRSEFARNGQIHVGYFSGSPSHKRDFVVVADALAQLFAEDRRLVLRVAGFLDLPSSLARFADRVERYPLQDFLNLQRLIGEIELNLVPLRNNVFTNCKSDLKYFEAAAVGTCTIASPTFAFELAIRDGINGWMARGHEWAERIAAAIADWQDYVAVAEQAAAHSRARYAPSVMTGAVEAALFGAPASPDELRDAGGGSTSLTPAVAAIRRGAGRAP